MLKKKKKKKQGVETKPWGALIFIRMKRKKNQLRKLRKAVRGVEEP